ncbi:hypothetical protein [Mesorhizobium sp. WSM2239]|uniref:Uncharacterized protein n=2 Tax=unclassified Mesorhizobium TaxID=325217 RepID=A0AAU8D468_9HYPH
MNDPATEGVKAAEQDALLPILRSIPQVSAGVAAVALLLGAASLTGKAYGLGALGAEFLTVSDIGVEAVKRAPLAIAIFAGFIFFRSVQGWGDKPNPIVPGYRASKVGLRFAVLLFFVGFLSVPPSLGANFVICSLMLGPVFLFNITVERARRDLIPRWMIMLAFVMAIGVIHFVGGYIATAGPILRIDGRSLPKHKICLSDGTCATAALLVRFAETSAFLSENEGTVAYLRNDAIQKIVALEPHGDQATIPIWTWLSSLLAWFKG